MFVRKNEDQLYCMWLAYCAYSGQAPKNVSGSMSCETPSADPECERSVSSAGGAALPWRTARHKPSNSQLLTHGKRIALLAIAYKRLSITSETNWIRRASVLICKNSSPSQVNPSGSNCCDACMEFHGELQLAPTQVNMEG